VAWSRAGCLASDLRNKCLCNIRLPVCLKSIQLTGVQQALCASPCKGEALLLFVMAVCLHAMAALGGVDAAKRQRPGRFGRVAV
jgi:hypothetical protein